MIALSFFGGGEALGKQMAASAVGLISVGGLFRQFLQTAKFQGFKNTLAQGNTWNYLAGVFALVLPQAGELIPALRELYDALIMGSWGLVITRGIALLTIAFYMFKKGK